MGSIVSHINDKIKEHGSLEAYQESLDRNRTPKEQELIVLLHRISMSALGTEFLLIVSRDQIHQNGRIYLQVLYAAPCTKTGQVQPFKGRKWYLSEFMTDDEVIKTAYCAFEAAVKHEVMEGFKVDDTILFNPHVNYEELLKISALEVSRQDITN